MLCEVEFSDEFGAWWDGLSGDEQESIAVVVELLAARGTSLGFPYSSQIVGSGIALRELRIQHRGAPYRVFYAFDPRRVGFLLLGGCKAGDDRFYDRMIPIAERIWKEHLREI